MSRRITWLNGSRASYAYLLDLFPNAVKAHSFQKLRAAYAGDVQVARGATTDDVPFIGNFQDNTELLNIVGAGDGFMPLWYDQSTAAADSTQVVALSQPKTVNSGVIATVNGYPVAQFDETDDYLVADDLVAHIGGDNAPWTMTAVVKWQQTVNGAIMCLGRTGGANLNFFGVFLTNTTTFGGTRAYIHKRTNGTNRPFVISGVLSTTDLTLITADFDGTDARLYVNGVLADTQNLAFAYSRAMNNCNIGRRDAGSAAEITNYLGSPLAEITVWPFSQYAAGNITGINNNIKSRYGIT